MLNLILAIIAKNFKILLTNKVSTSVIVLGPLLLFLMVGVAFSNSGFLGLKVAVYSEEYTNATNLLLEKLGTGQVTVLKAPTNESCVGSVISGQNHVCLVFPKNFDLRAQVTFYVDYSRMNIVWTLINLMSEKVSLVSKDLGVQTVQNMLNTLYDSSRTMNEGSVQVRNITSLANEMGRRLQSIDAQLGSLTISQPDVNPNEVQEELETAKARAFQRNAEMQSYISGSEQSLDLFGLRVEKAKSSLSKRKADEEGSHYHLELLYSNMSCTDSQVTDLTPYQDNAEQMQAALSTAQRPDCSLVYSFMKLQGKNLEEIKKAENDIELIEDEILSAKKQLESSKRQSEKADESTGAAFESMEEKVSSLGTALDGLERQNDDLQQKQGALRQEMQQMKSSLEITAKATDSLGTAMQNFSSKFNTLSLLDPQMVVMPLRSEVRPVEQLRDVSDYIFPSLLVLIITFVGILLSATIVMQERHSSAFFRNSISPVPDALFLLGTYLTVLAVVLVQVLVLLVFARLAFGIAISDLPSFIAAALLAASVFIGVGMLLSYALRSIEITIILSISVACLLFLFSSFVIPIEKMSPTAKLFASFNPFLIAEFIFRRIILFNESMTALLPSAGMLLAEMCVLSTVIFFAYLRAKKLSD